MAETISESTEERYGTKLYIPMQNSQRNERVFNTEMGGHGMLVLDGHDSLIGPKDSARINRTLICRETHAGQGRGGDVASSRGELGRGRVVRLCMFVFFKEEPSRSPQLLINANRFLVSSLVT